MISRLLFPTNVSLNKQFLSDLMNRWLELREQLWISEELKKNLLNLFNYMRSGLIRNNNKEPVDIIHEKMVNWIVKRCNI